MIVLAAFLALAGIGVVNSLLREARTRADYPPEGRMITVNGAPLHVLQMGEGPDLVLIHGASGNLRDFTFDLAPRLAERYRVTLIDRPGLGQSAPIAQGATIASQADHLSKAADQLSLRNPILLGHSYGGAVALAWGLRHPDQAAALVLLAAASHPWRGPLDAFHARLARPILGPALAWAIRAYVPRGYVRAQLQDVFAPQQAPRGYGDHIGLGLILRPGPYAENARQRTNLRAELIEQMPLYGTLRMPVEILHGTADTTVGLDIHSRALADVAPGARMQALPGVGHMLHHADPAATVAAVDRARDRLAEINGAPVDEPG